MKFSFDLLFQLLQLPILAVLASSEFLQRLFRRKSRDAEAQAPPEPPKRTEPLRDDRHVNIEELPASPFPDGYPPSDHGHPFPDRHEYDAVVTSNDDDFEASEDVEWPPADTREGIAEAELPPERKPRYASVRCLDSEGHEIRVATRLGADRVFTLRVAIDKFMESSLVRNPVEFPDAVVPDDVNLDVVLISKIFEFGNAAGGFSPGPVQDVLFLPGGGGAAKGPDGRPFLDFRLRIQSREEASCHINFQFRGAIIQSLLFTKESELNHRPGLLWADPVFSLSNRPADLIKVPERNRLSFLSAARKKGFNQLILYARDGGEPVSEIVELDIKGLSETIRRLRAALEERAPREPRRSRRDLEKDLREIAPIGAELFQLLPGQALSKLGPLLDAPEETVVHIARATSAEFVAPWSLVYDIPLTGAPPKLCEAVSTWDEKRPLFEPTARCCPHGPHGEDVLCPFGFWGLRYTIEQLVSTEEPSTEIVVGPSARIVTAQTLYDVDIQLLSRHLDTLAGIFRRRLPDALISVGKEKQEIRQLIGQDLPFLYFYCHGERDSDADPNVYLGVGNRESITAKDIGDWLWSWFRNDRLKIWDKTRPLVFINACNSVAIYPETLISYVNAFIGRANAAGVIGTEVKVSQTLAMAFAESFFIRLLTEGSSVDSALRGARIEFLSKGNLFGLVYTPYCWADLHVVGPTAAAG